MSKQTNEGCEAQEVGGWGGGLGQAFSGISKKILLPHISHALSPWPANFSKSNKSSARKEMINCR